MTRQHREIDVLMVFHKYDNKPIIVTVPFIYEQFEGDLKYHFGDKYKQWNAAFEAGYCAALGKSYITLHEDNIIHPLKEVDAASMAWASTPAKVVEILKYVCLK